MSTAKYAPFHSSSYSTVVLTFENNPRIDNAIIVNIVIARTHEAAFALCILVVAFFKIVVFRYVLKLWFYLAGRPLSVEFDIADRISNPLRHPL